MESKPCPFCGESASVLISDFTEADDIMFMVVCDLCGSAVGEASTSEKEAVYLWNTRPTEQAQAEKIERLEAVAEEYASMSEALAQEMEAKEAAYQRGRESMREELFTAIGTAWINSTPENNEELLKENGIEDKSDAYSVGCFTALEELKKAIKNIKA